MHSSFSFPLSNCLTFLLFLSGELAEVLGASVLLSTRARIRKQLLVHMETTVTATMQQLDRVLNAADDDLDDGIVGDSSTSTRTHNTSHASNASSASAVYAEATAKEGPLFSHRDSKPTLFDNMLPLRHKLLGGSNMLPTASSTPTAAPPEWTMETPGGASTSLWGVTGTERKKLRSVTLGLDES